MYNRLLALCLKRAVPKPNPNGNALDGVALDLLWTCSGLAPEPESVNNDAWTSDYAAG